MYQCTCRFVHVSCIVEANKHRQGAHHTCPTCKQKFVGALQMAVAEARVHTTRLNRNFDPAAVSGLAGALTDKASYPQALELYQKVLVFLQRQHGPVHPDVAATQDNMGIVLKEQRKLPEALEMHNKALRTRVAVLGPEHLDVAKTYNKYDLFFVPFLS